MARSYQRINYSLRPAKNIERKMLAEAFRRLYSLSDLATYRYIGFPSTFFSDFILFHKSLGFKKMIGIEVEERDRTRFEFNRPFNCIHLVFGHSNDALPRLSWTENDKTIAWLDYDCALEASVLADVQFYFSHAPAASIMVVTVNAEPSSFGKHDRRLSKFIELIGRDRVPPGTAKSDFVGWETAKLYRQIISNEIAETLQARNGLLSEGRRLRYMQLFNFHYKDGMRMLTLGGVIHTEEMSERIEDIGFQKHLFYVRTGSDPYLIDTPNLTLSEMRLIDQKLPQLQDQDLGEIPVPEADVRKYAKLYRWYPRFSEAEL